MYGVVIARCAVEEEFAISMPLVRGVYAGRGCASRCVKDEQFVLHDDTVVTELSSSMTTFIAE